MEEEGGKREEGGGRREEGRGRREEGGAKKEVTDNVLNYYCSLYIYMMWS